MTLTRMTLTRMTLTGVTLTGVTLTLIRRDSMRDGATDAQAESESGCVALRILLRGCLCCVAMNGAHKRPHTPPRRSRHRGP